VVLALDLQGADPGALCAALGLTALEAELRVRRGLQLHTVLDPAEAEAEATALAGAGFRVHRLPEAETRKAAQPQLVRGGGLRDGCLVLRVEQGSLSLLSGSLLLVVKGPIVREYQTAGDVKRLRSASLDQGYRFHLHTWADLRPLELDPAGFEFDEPPLSGSSLLELQGFVEAVTGRCPVDDSFRREPPALGVAVAGNTPLDAAKASRAASRTKAQASQERVVLDNVAQFRFFSGWRGALERRLAGSAARS
jgi:hypothetical protein